VGEADRAAGPEGGTRLKAEGWARSRTRIRPSVPPRRGRAGPGGCSGALFRRRGLGRRATVSTRPASNGNVVRDSEATMVRALGDCIRPSAVAVSLRWRSASSMQNSRIATLIAASASGASTVPTYCPLVADQVAAPTTEWLSLLHHAASVASSIGSAIDGSSFRLVHPGRDRPHAHQVRGERPHQLARVGLG
jgi:hypothetical protein